MSRRESTSHLSDTELTFTERLILFELAAKLVQQSRLSAQDVANALALTANYPLAGQLSFLIDLAANWNDTPDAVEVWFIAWGPVFQTHEDFEKHQYNPRDESMQKNLLNHLRPTVLDLLQNYQAVGRTTVPMGANASPTEDIWELCKSGGWNICVCGTCHHSASIHTVHTTLSQQMRVQSINKALATFIENGDAEPVSFLWAEGTQIAQLCSVLSFSPEKVGPYVVKQATECRQLSWPAEKIYDISGFAYSIALAVVYIADRTRSLNGGGCLRASITQVALRYYAQTLAAWKKCDKRPVRWMTGAIDNITETPRSLGADSLKGPQFDRALGAVMYTNMTIDILDNNKVIARIRPIIFSDLEHEFQTMTVAKFSRDTRERNTMIESHFVFFISKRGQPVAVVESAREV